MKLCNASAFVWLYLLFFSNLLHAQQPAPSTPASNVPAATLSTTTELVLVPVQVKDGDKPMLALKKEDFILRSDKQVQPIRVFEEWSSSTATPGKTSASVSNPTLTLNNCSSAALMSPRSPYILWGYG